MVNEKLLYTQFFPGDRLSRITDSVVSMVPGNGFGDSRARAILEQVANDMNDATHGAVHFQVTDRSGAVGAVVEYVTDDSRGNRAGYADRHFDENRITGGKVVVGSGFAETGVGFGLVLHETAHAFGLGHSNDPDDLMASPSQGGNHFSPKEHLAITMMLQRQPGTAFPDDDTQAQSSSNRRQTITVTDEF